MEESPEKSTSLETLVVQNSENLTEIIAKLEEIIQLGKDYEHDITNSLKILIKNRDPIIVTMSVQALAELVKSDERRELYASIDIIQPILKILEKDISCENVFLIKQCCRALGNLCCDSDKSRQVIYDCKGMDVLGGVLIKSLKSSFEGIKLLTLKTILNYSLGGPDFTKAMEPAGFIDIMQKILEVEYTKNDCGSDMVSTALLILGVLKDNTSDILFSEELNILILNILRETTNIEVSELCLDHLHAQAEHDSIKVLLAKEGGLQLVCSRLTELMDKHDKGDLNAEDSDVEAIIKQACDLIIIVLTGDEAMQILYNNGVGEVYVTMVKWLDSPNYHLLTTSILAIGNFARKDDYCAQMMEDKIFDKLLDIFETYHGFAVRMNKEPNVTHLIDMTTVSKVQHAVLSALRNLTVPPVNKRVAAAKGRAAPVLLKALPNVDEHHVAYKLLAAIRMLVDGQESVAKQLASNRAALANVARWGLCGELAGAAGEAPRLLAWAIKLLTHDTHWKNILEVEGCVPSLVYMLVANHSLMQNEAILALTLLAIESFKKLSPDAEQSFDCEKSFITQLLKSEIGKHITVLINTNLTKMPVEVAENLMAFLDITSMKNKLALDYKEAKVHEALNKFAKERNDFTPDMKACVGAIITSISANVEENK